MALAYLHPLLQLRAAACRQQVLRLLDFEHGIHIDFDDILVSLVALAGTFLALRTSNSGNLGILNWNDTTRLCGIEVCEVKQGRPLRTTTMSGALIRDLCLKLCQGSQDAGYQWLCERLCGGGTCGVCGDRPHLEHEESPLPSWVASSICKAHNCSTYTP